MRSHVFMMRNGSSPRVKIKVTGSFACLAVVVSRWLRSWSPAMTPAAQAAPTVPDGFQQSTVIDGLTRPTVVEFSLDGRVFVTERSEIIKAFDGLDDPTPDTFADLTDDVYSFWDRGLLGMAPHPDSPDDPNTTEVEAPARRRTAAWSVVGCRCSLQAAHKGDGNQDVLIEEWCQQYPSHSIVALEFGADGSLYASAGDGASFNWADYGVRGDPQESMWRPARRCRGPAHPTDR